MRSASSPAKWNNVLWYVKGGAAVTHDKYNDILAGVVFDSANETRWGGAVGYRSRIRAELVGRRGIRPSVHGPAQCQLHVARRTDGIKQDIDMATVHVNYRFGGPVVAKY